MTRDPEHTCQYFPSPSSTILWLLDFIAANQKSLAMLSPQASRQSHSSAEAFDFTKEMSSVMKRVDRAKAAAVDGISVITWDH